VLLASPEAQKAGAHSEYGIVNADFPVRPHVQHISRVQG
jgi:hypothetical protein